ncbi:MAG: DUF58 domain-containing protein, partial [Planctomycetia bacterium]|nr:DUF58 domain-containing protein [Planctomycetia bacterium]
MVIRRRAWLTREGWYYLAVLIFIIGGAVLRSVNLLVILAGTMIAPLLFNWRLAMASLTALVIHRRLPTQTLAGEPLIVEIQLENKRWWMSSWLLRVEDWIEDFRMGKSNQGKPIRAEAMIAHLPAGGHAIGSYRVTLNRRGRYRFGPLRVGTRFPLGLVLGQMTLPDHGELIVAPRLGFLLPAWANLLHAEQLGDERRHPQRGISEGDYYGLRPWQSGDSLRWVHWRTTAKLARPVVRQYERRHSREVAIILDPWLPPDATDRDEGLAELAISLAATALHDISNRGHSRLTIAIAGRDPECHSGPASAHFCEDLLAELAELVVSD